MSLILAIPTAIFIAVGGWLMNVADDVVLLAIAIIFAGGLMGMREE